MSKQSYWFSHDYNASSDPKLIKLKRSMGHEGIGIYWEIVEILYSEGGSLSINSLDDYAFTMHTTSDKLSKVISNFELFVNDGILFWSETIKRRLALREEKSEKAKQSISKRWGKKKKDDTNVLPTKNERIFIPPSLEEVISYFKENNYSEEQGRKAYHYYNSADWKDSKGNNVRNWKQKMHGNWFKENNHSQQNGFVL